MASATTHPAYGSFIQQDSFVGMAMMTKSMNRYAYAHGNPVINTDPSGHVVGIDDAAAIILIGFLLGTLYGVARQDAEIRDGTRAQTDFSLSEAVVNEGLPGAVIAPALAFSGPVGLAVGGGLSVIGIAHGIEELQAGRTHAGNVDIVFGALGLVGTAYGVKQTNRRMAGTLLSESTNAVGAEQTSLALPTSRRGSVANSVRLLAASDRYINEPTRLLSGAVEEAQPRVTRFIADAEGNIADVSNGRGSPWLRGAEDGYIGPERQLTEGKRTLNIGSGKNPLEGAINVDKEVVKGVDVAADANRLPFKAGTFDEAVSINPYEYNPLESDVGRVLKPGGTLEVVGQERNFVLRQLRKASPEYLRSLGYERVGEGWRPADLKYKFGTPRTTAGNKIDPRVFKQLTFRKLP